MGEKGAWRRAQYLLSVCGLETASPRMPGPAEFAQVAYVHLIASRGCERASVVVVLETYHMVGNLPTILPRTVWLGVTAHLAVVASDTLLLPCRRGPLVFCPLLREMFAFVHITRTAKTSVTAQIHGPRLNSGRNIRSFWDLSNKIVCI